MNLLRITIKDYRSIKEVSFDVAKRDDDSFAFGFIGINEAGKSSILKAIGLKDGLVDTAGIKLPLASDFRAKDKDIKVTYCYKLREADDTEAYSIINKPQEAAEEPQPTPEQPAVGPEDTPDAPEEVIQTQNIAETNDKPPSEILVNYIISFTSAEQEPVYTVSIFDNDTEINVNNKDKFDEYINDNVHESIFWTAEDRYLISKPISIEQFIADVNTSIPLRNCFRLAAIGESEISQKLTDAQTDSTECEYLENELGEKVTEHIKSAWPNHPIEITFKIMDGHINFHVKDTGAKGKAQTSDMRSDGFKQFVSFLLTIAAENRNEELQNSILLLDEPETHLHPKAQEYLLTQLINITNNNKSNVVFFATHSNYMIDKQDLGRYYRVKKNKNKNNEEETEIIEFDNKSTTYAEVSYEVFDILDEQYHNELYDKLRDRFVLKRNEQESDAAKYIDSIGIRPFDEQYFSQEKKLPKSFKDTSKPDDDSFKVTLPTFIRNCIHYPANKKANFDDKLAESIQILRGYLEDLKTEKQTEGSAGQTTDV